MSTQLIAGVRLSLIWPIVGLPPRMQASVYRRLGNGTWQSTAELVFDVGGQAGDGQESMALSGDGRVVAVGVGQVTNGPGMPNAGLGRSFTCYALVALELRCCMCVRALFLQALYAYSVKTRTPRSGALARGCSHVWSPHGCPLGGESRTAASSPAVTMLLSFP